MSSHSISPSSRLDGPFFHAFFDWALRKAEAHMACVRITAEFKITMASRSILADVQSLTAQETRDLIALISPASPENPRRHQLPDVNSQTGRREIAELLDESLRVVENFRKCARPGVQSRFLFIPSPPTAPEVIGLSHQEGSLAWEDR